MVNRSQLAIESSVSYAAQSHTRRLSAPVAVLSAILFLSGIGALIFETLWLRLSGLHLATRSGAALILSSFMAGLALGNAIAAASKIRDGGRFIFTPCWRCWLLCLVAQSFWSSGASGLLRPVWQLLWNYQPALLGLRFIVSS